jgi:DNA-binding PadR family transcriptional regulator
MELEESRLGRFAEPALLILVSLAGGAKHGYAIMEDIVRLSGRRVGPGTLYAVIPRLESRGLIAPLPESERRRPYRLTDQGAAVLQDQLQSMQQVASAGLQRLAVR